MQLPGTGSQNPKNETPEKSMAVIHTHTHVCVCGGGGPAAAAAAAAAAMRKLRISKRDLREVPHDVNVGNVCAAIY